MKNIIKQIVTNILTLPNGRTGVGLLLMCICGAITPQRLWAQDCKHTANGQCSTCGKTVAYLGDEDNAEGVANAIHWEYIKNGDTDTYTLEISGTGAMKNYSYSNYTPWFIDSEICNKLTAVKIGSGITGIGDNAFESYINISSATLPSGLTRIGNWALGNTKLSSITIPSGVKSIGEYAFSTCTNLSFITIPKSVASIGDGAFDNCYVNEDNLHNSSGINLEGNVGLTIFYTEQDGLLIKDNIVVKYRGNATNVEIPNTVKGIGDCAFKEYKNLTTITLPSGLKSIGKEAFYGCTDLISVNLPSSLQSIGAYAFYKCSSLTSITLPSSLQSIGEQAYSSCKSLKTVTFNSIPLFGSDIFMNCNLSYSGSTLSDDSYVYTGTETNNFPNFTANPTYTRTLSKGWEAIVLPFAVSVSEYSNYEFYTVGGVVGREFVREKVTGTLAAGTPVLIHKLAGGDNNLTLTASNKTLNTTINNPEEFSGLTFTGTYATAPLASGAGYVCEGTGFRKTTAATDVAPFHAYLAGSIDGIDAFTPHSCGQLIHHTTKAPTCNATGIRFDYWSCPVCGKAYSDAAGTTPVVQDSWVDTRKPHSFSDGICTLCGGKGSVITYTTNDDNGLKNLSSDWSYNAEHKKVESSHNLSNRVGKFTFDGIVTRITESAFNNCTNLASIVLPNTIQSIDNTAFSGCTNLTNVTLNSIPEVGNNFASAELTLTLSDDSYVVSGSELNLTANPTFTRKLTTEWETIVLPFAVSISENDDYEIYTFGGVTGSYLFIYKATGTLAAGTPVLIRKKAEGNYNLTLTASETTARTSITNPEYRDLTFTGTYTTASVALGAGYVCNGSQFVKTTESTDVAPFHAYLAGTILDVSTLTLHIHDLTVHGEKYETCTDDGNCVYYSCDVCGMYFSDEEGKNEIAKDSWVIPSKGGHKYNADGICTVCNSQHLASFDLTITSRSNSEVIISKQSAKHIIINKSGGGMPQVAVKSGTEGTQVQRFAHGERYDIAITDIPTFNAGGDDLNGDIVAKAKRRQVQEEAEVQQPTFTGPALVLEGAIESPFYLEEYTSITLEKMSNGTYLVNGNKVRGTVTAIYFYYAHTLTPHPATEVTCIADGNTTYYDCSVCEKYFSDADAEKEIAEDSWVIPSTGTEHDYTALAASADETTGLYSVVCSHNAEHVKENTMAIKDFYTNATGYERHLELTGNPGSDFSSTRLIELTDANQFKDVNVRFTTGAAPTYTRKMTTEWGTLVLPFEISATQDDFKFYNIKDIVDNNALILWKVGSSAISAGTPVFVRRTGTNTTLTLTATGQMINTDIRPGDLKGSYAVKDLTSGYIINNDMLWSVEELTGNGKTVKMAPFRAYLDTESYDAKLQIVVEDVTTSINNEQLTINNEAGAVYNLQGQRLSAPQKGINIINGKKVLVK